MGKDTGFLEYKRTENRWVPVEERIHSYRELHTPLESTARREQAAVCMNCGVPFCQSAMRLNGMVTGCPLHNLIPEWNDEIYHGHDARAFERLQKTASFPEFTGRVCPALCEKACMCGQYGDAVTIHDNELYLIETAFANGYIRPQIPARRSGRRVAIVGSGPSGLACADALNRRGHSVTVYEREDAVGGLLMYGIPNMKLDKRVIRRRQELMEQEGVVFVLGSDVGRDVAPKELYEAYDAVVLCCGAKQPRSIPAVAKTGVSGVHYAVDFLTATTKALMRADDLTPEALEAAGGFISAKGKDVVIIGGGDTGNDCIATCVRHGARSVTAIEMLPAPPKERAADNPWPQWPRVLKNDYGHVEAAFVYGHDPRVFATTVGEIKTDEGGQITQAVLVGGQWKDGKWTDEKGSERLVPCQLLLIAAGFTGAERYVTDSFQLKQTPRGTVPTLVAAGDGEPSYQTKTDKLFAAGDMRRGQSLVVWAIAEGRACAAEVDQYLMGYTTM